MIRFDEKCTPRRVAAACVLGFCALNAVRCGSGLDTLGGGAASCAAGATWPGTYANGVAGGIVVINDVAIDCAANVYAVGNTNRAIDGQVLHDTSGSDFFISMLAPNGKRVWTIEDGPGPGATNTAVPNAMAVDASGNIYVVGYVRGGLDGQVALADSSNYDFFVTKYSPDRVRLWTVQDGPGGATTANAVGIALDASNNIYVAGRTQGAIDGQAYRTSASLYDLFLIKYDSNGSRIWTVEDGLTGANTETWGVTIDHSGGVYVVGGTTGSLDGQPINGMATASFVTKYDFNKNRQWTLLNGYSGGTTKALAAAADTLGNLYVTGYTNGALPGIAGHLDATVGDIFLSKYTVAGVLQWTLQDGSGLPNRDAKGYAVTTDAANNVIVYGGVQGSLHGQVQHDQGGSAWDYFLSKFDPNGQRLWTAQDGGGGVTSNAVTPTFALDGAGNIYVGGQNDGTPPGTTGLDGNIQIGTDDAFVTQYSPDGVRH